MAGELESVVLEAVSALEECKTDHRITGLARKVITHLGIAYLIIQQNPAKKSHWGQLAKSGSSVYQVIEASSGHYVAVVVNSVYHEY